MPTASSNGHDLHYQLRGHGPPLLLVMGMSGNHRHWGEPFLRELQSDFEVLSYDHRGVGSSAWVTEPFTIADLADDAAGLLDAVGWPSAHVLGISMGGMVAQELALSSPHRVRTLTLGCTYAGGEGSALTDPEVMTRLATAMESGDRERAIRAGWEANVSVAWAEDPEHYLTFSEVAHAQPAAMRVIMLQMHAISHHDTSARLKEIAAPTLVIHGSADEMLDAHNGELIARAIPGARLEVMEEVGHLFFWERPQRSAALVRELALESAAPQ